jgi:membrane associated rhomboid family serine protease
VILIALCALIEIVLVMGDQGWLPTPRLRETAYEYGGFWPGLLSNWVPNYALQPYLMFLSYALLHGGPGHMIFNMVTLYSLGLMVHFRVGMWGFTLIYLAAVVGGALCFGLLAESTRPMVGASGGIFGLVGALLAWNYVDRFIAAENLWPVLFWVTGLLVLNLVQWWLMDGVLAWQTHLGGFVAGWIAALVIDPRARPAPPDD